MGGIKNRVAVAATTAGLAVGFGSCGADIVSCPGEVKRAGHEVPVTYCDENPDSNDILNNPGTPEQKLMYGGFLLTAIGGGALILSRRREP